MRPHLGRSLTCGMSENGARRCGCVLRAEINWAAVSERIAGWGLMSRARDSGSTGQISG
jgi:hypothetical protein